MDVKSKSRSRRIAQLENEFWQRGDIILVGKTIQ
jgi:hypothetical protein